MAVLNVRTAGRNVYFSLVAGVGLLRVAVYFAVFALVACGSLVDESSRIARRAAETDAAPKSSTKELQTFYFDSAITGLSTNYAGIFTGTNIVVRLPYGVGLTALRPSFTSNGIAVQVAGTPQVSGVTSNNFTGLVTYNVLAEDGSSQAYSISVRSMALLQDTGQALCFNLGSTIPCNDTTFPRQDGDFISLPNARSVQATSTPVGYPADNINRDTANGIAWKTCPQGLSGAGCATGSPGNQTLALAAAACSNLNTLNSGAGYGGLQNWRLPSAMELMQIQHFVTNSVFYDPAIFPGAPSVNTWSSTQLGGVGNGIYVNGNYGNNGTGSSYGVRCVAGAGYPAHTFSDRGDGTVRESVTGLIWQKCVPPQANDATCTGSVTGTSWSQALQDCKNLTLAGRSWRMPNMNESMALFDFTRNSAPYVDTAAFPNFPPTGTPVPRMWTSTSLIQNTSYAYVVEYSSTSTGTLDAKNATATGANLYYGRCVSGP